MRLVSRVDGTGLPRCAEARSMKPLNSLNWSSPLQQGQG
jgi:hypothetical protein